MANKNVPINSPFKWCRWISEKEKSFHLFRNLFVIYAKLGQKTSTDWAPIEHRRLAQWMATRQKEWQRETQISHAVHLSTGWINWVFSTYMHRCLNGNRDRRSLFPFLFLSMFFVLFIRKGFGVFFCNCCVYAVSNFCSAFN